MAPNNSGEMEYRLAIEDYASLVSKLSSWRIDQYVRYVEDQKKRGWGNVLPFVRGLRLSSQLIYVIRKKLMGSALTADWGHLLDKDGNYLSPECDIIVYDKQGEEHVWNDDIKPVFTFKFIKCTHTKLVISCKSFLNPSNIEVDYFNELKKHVEKIWLFAEYCGPKSPRRIEETAKRIGYQEFFFLYTWSKKTSQRKNEKGWIKFITEIKKLVD